MSDIAPFPWGEAMGFAFVRLNLSPEAFWAMTPRELAAAIRFAAGPQQTAPDGDALRRLMASFPDDHRRM